MSVEDLIGLGLIFGILYILSDALSGVESAFGVEKLPTSAPPAPPTMQNVQFSPNCPAGYIEDSDGNCIQVTSAIHP
jgi:hypothetical protein